MKTIGVIGGMSWESTALYYRMLNEGVKTHLGGLHSAKIAMLSVDFEEIEALQASGDWTKAGDILADCGMRLKAAGADFILIATNTMHRVADQVEAKSRLPLLHIADATGEQIKTKSLRKVGLLGTAYTMEQAFYRGRLEAKFDVEVITPDQKGRKEVHRIIYEELCLGEVKDASRKYYLDIIEDMRTSGAEAVILGCTEIGMLVREHDTDLPILDTTAIHAETAVKLALDS